jgi:transposase-like protein
LESGKPLCHVARQLEVNPNTLHRWRREFKEQPTKAFSGQGRRVLAESHEAELERKIGQLTMANDFLKKLLRSFEEQQAAVNGGAPSISRSGRRKAGNQVMPCSGGQSRQLLSVPQAGQREGRRDGIARRNPETSGANAGLWGSHHSEAHNHRTVSDLERLSAA